MTNIQERHENPFKTLFVNFTSLNGHCYLCRYIIFSYLLYQNSIIFLVLLPHRHYSLE